MFMVSYGQILIVKIFHVISEKHDLMGFAVKLNFIGILFNF